jgi:hypothetical protein
MRLLLVCTFFIPWLSVAALQESWEVGYQGDAAPGKHVLGYWKFDEGAELKDSSGKGNNLAESGARIQVPGKKGTGMESFPGFPVTDQPHSLRVIEKERLTPTGAFSMEMWVQPKAEFEKAGRCYLLDKRYIPNNHTDYDWRFTEGDKSGARRMAVTLGFGATSETFYSENITLPAGQWQHIAVTYDARGTVIFYHNGSRVSHMSKPGLGSLAPGTRSLHLGDRIGSNYGGFPGFMDEVRICDGALKFEPIELTLSSTRQVWRRMESGAEVQILCTNLRREPAKDAKLHLQFAGHAEVIALPELQAGASHTHILPIQTNLKPDLYLLSARLVIGDFTSTSLASYEIVARPTPQMPVILWGGGDMAHMKDIGFTHYLSFSSPNLSEIWDKRHEAGDVPAAKPEVIAETYKTLDESLSKGLNVIGRLSPSAWLMTKPELLRVGRDGKAYERQDINASNPELVPFFEKVGRSFSQAYAQHPAMSAVMINTEVRDASNPSFNEIDVTNYRDFAKTEIPKEVVNRWGVEYRKLKDFPANRVIEDDHPLLKYYRWFWTVGDGWNGLHTALSKGTKDAAPKDFWTFFDPAVRQPSISGAGGNVDVIAHWTYTYPDPQRIGLCADQLFAMSEASGLNQQVMKMTQLIWYRSQTAPIQKNKPPGDTTAWDDHDPDAAYITIAPMHLKQALWTKLSRPVQGIMYHGWESLVSVDRPSTYRYTNPNTVHVLKELLHDVVRPLGPTLMSIPDEPADIALLESFTSQMFARRGGWGNNMNWSADVWLALQHAHVRTDIMYEETLLKKGLAGRKILLMPECEVLTKSVVAKIQDWQNKGGKIIADEFLCPELKADFVIQSFKRVKKAAEDKARVLELAVTLGDQIAALGHTPTFTADSPEAILRLRKSGEAQYLFVINDKREAGNYVGQYGLVLENGLPLTTTLSSTESVGAIYDLTQQTLVIPEKAQTWKVALGPCDGRIFMLLPKPLKHLRVKGPEKIKAGAKAEIKIKVSDEQDAAVKAVIPLQVEIRDANGKAAEGSGFYAAKGGELTLTLDLASNEDPGSWEIRVHELASRMESIHWMYLEH